MPTLLHGTGADWDELFLLGLAVLFAVALTWMLTWSRGR